MNTLTKYFVISFSLVATIFAYADKPNIVILYADDMGYGDLAIQNPESKIPTPHLDQLAREGMRFTDGHSSSSICSPSRYALLTGNHHWRKHEGLVNEMRDSAFDDEELTLAEMLQENGYNTACVGKWHLGFGWIENLKPEYKDDPNVRASFRKGLPADYFDWTKQAPNGPTSVGFEYYFGDGTPNFPPYGWVENDTMLVAPTTQHVVDPIPPEGNAECRPGPSVEGWQLDEVMPKLTEKAVAWIDTQKGSDEPFFLYFPWTSPHTPIVPTDEFFGKSQAGPYGDFVVQSDWSAGQVLEAIRRNGFEDKTIVIFTADNGSSGLMISRAINHKHNSSGPLRGKKTEIYEGGHRVPFVIKWPGVIKPGSISDTMISQVDIMATIAEIIGYELPADQCHDGVSMLRVLTGEQEKVRDTLINQTKGEQFAIRNNEWLLILDTEHSTRLAKRGKMGEFMELYDFPDVEESEALYNLNNDLGQRVNLIHQYPERVAEMKDLLSSIREGSYPEKSQN